MCHKIVKPVSDNNNNNQPFYFARFTRNQGGLEPLPILLCAASGSYLPRIQLLFRVEPNFVDFHIVVFLLNLVLWSEKGKIIFFTVLYLLLFNFEGKVR